MIPSVLVVWEASPSQQMMRAMEYGDGSRYAEVTQHFRVEGHQRPEAVATLLALARVVDGVPTVTIGRVPDESLVSWGSRAVLHPSFEAIVEAAAPDGLTSEQRQTASRWLAAIRQRIARHEERAAQELAERRANPNPGDSLLAFQRAPLPGVVTYSDGSREVVDAQRAAELEAQLAAKPTP